MRYATAKAAIYGYAKKNSTTGSFTGRTAIEYCKVIRYCGFIRIMAVSHHKELFHCDFYQTPPMIVFIIVFIYFKHQLYLSGYRG